MFLNSTVNFLMGEGANDFVGELEIADFPSYALRL